MSSIRYVLSVILALITLSECRPLRLIDLTYTYNDDTPAHPIFKKMQRLNPRTETVGNNSFQIAEFYGSEHAGTHVDSPYHSNKDKIKLDEIPLALFEGPGVVVDITHKADLLNNPDAAVTLEDVENWEKANGLIPEGSVVLMYSGWGKYAFNKTLYFGNKELAISDLHFPSFHEEACKFLTEFRNVRAIGVDTVSTDMGITKTFPCHKIIAQVNGIGLENVANVDLLPPKGSYIRAYPVKIEGGTGAPTRIIATIDNRPDSS